jgi:carboxyl-terminal processing protease
MGMNTSSLRRISRVRNSKIKKSLAVTAGAALALVVASASSEGSSPEAAIPAADTTQACAPAGGSSTGTASPASVATVEEAYFCLLANYAAAPHVDDQQLLRGALGGIVGYLRQRQLDQPFATLPALSGMPADDWLAFAGMYDKLASTLPSDTTTQQALATAAIKGTVDSLHDDHTDYTPAGQVPTQPPPSLGMYVRFPGGTPATAIVTELTAKGPAQQAGLRRGDTITAVNGNPVPAPPVRRGASMSPAFDAAAFEWSDFSSPGLGWLTATQPAVVLTITRPSTGKTLTLAVQARQLPPQNLDASIMPGNIAYVRIHDFTATEGNDVLAAINDLGLGTALRGVVIDIRGNTGGSPKGMAQLASAFVHDMTLSTTINGSGAVTVQKTDDTVPLLHQPLAVIVDGASLSAADMFSAIVKDLNLGVLVGERTAGVVAGPAQPFTLDDGSLLTITSSFSRGPDGEIIDGVGVPVDDAAPLPGAADLSAGKDPGLAQALAALRG